MSDDLPEMLNRAFFLSDFLYENEIGDGKNSAKADRLLGLEMSYAALLYFKKQGRFEDVEARGGSLLIYAQSSLMRAYVDMEVVKEEVLEDPEIADSVVNSVFGEFL